MAVLRLPEVWTFGATRKRAGLRVSAMAAATAPHEPRRCSEVVRKVLGGVLSKPFGGPLQGPQRHPHHRRHELPPLVPRVEFASTGPSQGTELVVQERSDHWHWAVQMDLLIRLDTCV